MINKDNQEVINGAKYIPPKSSARKVNKLAIKLR
jgi:hypothetical protein